MQGNRPGLSFYRYDNYIDFPLDLVVRKQISAHPELKVNRGFYFSCFKVYLKAN